MTSALPRAFWGLFVLLMATTSYAADLYVSPAGDDRAPGTIGRPFATLKRAMDAIADRRKGHPLTVHLRGGTYYLSQTLRFTASHSGTAESPVVLRAYRNERVVVSGGQRLALDWRPFKEGIFQARVPAGFATEELFINGERQILARYPNFDPDQRVFNGFAADAIDRARVAKWADPVGAYFHAMHPAEWGDYAWRITGKTREGEVTMEGGWQNNRPAGPHPTHRFVENVFEELDAPGEWFLDRKTHTLYFFPPPGVDLSEAVTEATCLRSLIAFQGTRVAPVRHVRIHGLTFRHAARTFMETREPMLRGDWAVYRGGAIYYSGAEDCVLEGCFLDQLGGNAIFVDKYNRRLTFRTLHIARAGATGIHFVGDPRSARSPLFNYDQTQPLEKIDLTPGPQGGNYPADCLVEDCLIYLTGRTEKQTAGINIDLAQSITIRHCSIYDMPRAGINIGDGCWGGHIVEHCDIFDTVKETGDHGSFNSWGRDRFWNPDIEITNRWVKQNPTLPFLDVVKPIVLRNNRWRCDHGWDIDLDDGASNYVITNNLCLNGGIKNREGYRRIVTNNVLVNNGFHPHVWYADSGDVFRNNIVWRTYAPARMYVKPWSEGMDANFLHLPGGAALPAAPLQALSGRDETSLTGDAGFLDPARGDYRVRRGSPALRLGFRNFRMDRFGVTSPSLRSIARTPRLSLPSGSPSSLPLRSGRVIEWLGGKVRDIRGPGETSAFGTPGENGVLLLEVPEPSRLYAAGLRPNDVIVALNSKPALAIGDLVALTPVRGTLKITYLRNQQRCTATLGRP